MKICSLIPSGTEIAFALGVGDRVVGVTEYCNYPPEARRRRVVSRGVIDIFRLSAREVDERVQALAKADKPAYLFDTQWLAEVRPDLILTQEMCRSCDLEASTVFDAIVDFEPKPQVLILNPRRLADIFSNIKRVGEATGVAAMADELVRKLQGRIDRIVQLVSLASYRPRVLFLEWTDPPSPAGDWIPEQVELAGGRPQLGEAGLAPVRMTWDAVVECDPDVIIIGPCSHNIARSLREMPALVRREGWWDLKAVRAGNVYIVDSEYYDRPGPRVITGIEVLARLLHPELVASTVQPHTVVRLERSGRPCPPEEIPSLFQPYPQYSETGVRGRVEK